MENRHGLVVQGNLTRADGRSERRAALDMLHRHSPGSIRLLTLGSDKEYDAAEFVADLRQACVTPHVARKARHSAIDGRTTRHKGYALPRKYRGLPPSPKQSTVCSNSRPRKRMRQGLRSLDFLGQGGRATRRFSRPPGTTIIRRGFSRPTDLDKGARIATPPDTYGDLSAQSRGYGLAAPTHDRTAAVDQQTCSTASTLTRSIGSTNCFREIARHRNNPRYKPVGVK